MRAVDIDAMQFCFSDSGIAPPTNGKPGRPVWTGSTTGWKLVAKRPLDPSKHPDNPYASAGCYSAENCRELWFQKDSGAFRYCVTNKCWAASVGFAPVDGEMKPIEGRTVVCTS